MDFKELVCELNRKFNGVFGRNKVKTHDVIQAYNNMSNEYYAEISETQLIDDLVFYDDEYDIFIFFIVRNIHYTDQKNYTNTVRLKENVNAELVVITKTEIIEQIIGVGKDTSNSKDVYFMNSIFVQLLANSNIKVNKSVLDVATNEKKYMIKNTISVEHRIISIEFTYENILSLCIDLNCIYNKCI